MNCIIQSSMPCNAEHLNSLNCSSKMHSHRSRSKIDAEQLYLYCVLYCMKIVSKCAIAILEVLYIYIRIRSMMRRLLLTALHWWPFDAAAKCAWSVLVQFWCSILYYKNCSLPNIVPSLSRLVLYQTYFFMPSSFIRTSIHEVQTQLDYALTTTVVYQAFSITPCRLLFV